MNTSLTAYYPIKISSSEDQSMIGTSEQVPRYILRLSGGIDHDLLTKLALDEERWPLEPLGAFP